VERRSFLRAGLVGGVATAAAVRTFPFRVFSFPSRIVEPRWERHRGEWINLSPAPIWEPSTFYGAGDFISLSCAPLDLDYYWKKYGRAVPVSVIGNVG